MNDAEAFVIHNGNLQSIKSYYKDVETLTLPIDVTKFDITMMASEEMPNLKLIICENPDVEMFRSLLNNKEVGKDVYISIDGQEPQSLVDLYNSTYPCLSDMCGSTKITSILNNRAATYEETDGTAKITFDNGQGIYVGSDNIKVFVVDDGTEKIIDSLENTDIKEKISRVEDVFEYVSSFDSANINLYEAIEENKGEVVFGLDD
jgi:hypothetical protein